MSFSVPTVSDFPLPELSAREIRARRHVAYLYILTTAFKLDEADRKACERAWNDDPDEHAVRSIPIVPALYVVEYDIQEHFDHDLRHVPGFYYDMDYTGLGRWRLNIPKGARLVSPYYDGEEIAGLYTYRHPKDKLRQLLTSAGLLWGTPAQPPVKERAA